MSPPVGAFHDAVGQLDYPMIIVTAASGGERSGCLVGFSTQCSIDPARFLVCISEKNHTFRVSARSEYLGVHFLDRRDRPLSLLFGEQTGDETDKFDQCAWTERRGVPVLDSPPAWFVGRVLERIRLGDHVGHLLEPVEGKMRGRLDQLSFQQVKSMTPGHDA